MPNVSSAVNDLKPIESMPQRKDLEITMDGELWIPCLHVEMTLEQAIKYHTEVLETPVRRKE